MSESSRTETHSQNQKTAQTKSENKTESENNTNNIKQEGQHPKNGRNHSVLPTNRDVKEGRAPFTPSFWPQIER